ncbi:hypothetical protein XHV734_3383 [Xanthomonas hortorum pv. vitians]|nr:hypothetical protein XHV734_3383 [Xanthomonas hortorum pv. vitians]
MRACCQLHKLLSRTHELAQLSPPRLHRLIGTQLKGGRHAGQIGRIQAICFCRQTGGSSEGLAAARIGPHDLVTGVEQGIQYLLFVTARGLQDNLASLLRRQPGQQLAMARGCVVKPLERAAMDGHIQHGLAHINPDAVHG